MFEQFINVHAAYIKQGYDIELGIFEMHGVPTIRVTVGLAVKDKIYERHYSLSDYELQNMIKDIEWYHRQLRHVTNEILSYARSDINPVPTKSKKHWTLVSVK